MELRMSWVTGIAETVWRFIRLLAELIWIMLAVSVASLYHGVPESRKRIAVDWERRIIAWGRLTTDRLPVLYRVCTWVALAVILIFWIVIAEITVLILRLKF